MIIRLESGTAENVEAARQSLEALAHSWGHELAADPVPASQAAVPARSDDKAVDPVSTAALALSIPSAALAVLDLADRITKRRRAKELIDQTRQFAAQHVTVSVMTQNRPLELAPLDPDQLLDLMTHEDQGK